MRVFMFKVGQPLRRRLWHPIRGIMDIFHLLPPVAAIVIFKLLTSGGQLRELYIGYVEQANVVQIALAFVGLSMISSALYASHYWLSAIRQNIIFANFVRPNIGINFRRIRRLTGLIWSFLPWLGLAIGLLWADQHLAETDARLSGALGADAAQLLAGDLRPRIWLAIVLVLAAGIGIATLLDTCRQSRPLLWGFVVATVAVIAFAAIAPLREADTVSLYREMGPIATLSIAILFVFSAFALLALLSQKSGFPALTLIVTAVAVGTLFDIPFAVM